MYKKLFETLVKAFRQAKGRNPEGLDLIKIKQQAAEEARQAEKIIKFPESRITDPFKPRPGDEAYNKLIDPKSDIGQKLAKLREESGGITSIKTKKPTQFVDDVEFDEKETNFISNVIQNRPGFNLKLAEDLKKGTLKTEGDKMYTPEQRKKLLRDLKSIMKNEEYVARYTDEFADMDINPTDVSFEEFFAKGGKVKKSLREKIISAVGGPAALEAELGLSGILELYNILGMPLAKGGSVKESKGLDYLLGE